MLLGCYIPHPLLSRQEFAGVAMDWFVFGNACLELRRNMLGEPLALRRALAGMDSAKVTTESVIRVEM